MKNLKKEFIKLKKIIPKSSNIYLEADLIKLKDFFLNQRKEKVLDIIFKEFKNIIGPEGNLIVPAFTYTWGENEKKKVFDIKKTLPKTGLFPNFLLNKSGVARTCDPMFSFLIYGKNKNFLKTIGNSSFGKNSVFEKINSQKTFLISFGLNKFDPTFVHFVEEYFDKFYKPLKYRFIKKYTGYYLKKKKKSKGIFFSFSRNLKMNKFYSEKKIKKSLQYKKKLKKIIFFNFEVYIVKASDFFEEGIIGLKKDLNFFVK